MSAYPVMLLEYHGGIGNDGAWVYKADEPPAKGDEIVITHTSSLPGGDAMSVRVEAVGDSSPFPITAAMLS
jgi:hypothetical protein